MESIKNESSRENQLPQSSASRGKIGIFLILLSGVFFFSMLSVPWWPLSGGSKAIIGGALFVGVQVAWWVGAAVVGPVAIAKLTSWFRRG